MNIENFLDPYGGSGQNSTVNSGFMGILGIGLSFNISRRKTLGGSKGPRRSLVDKFYFEPIARHYRKQFKNEIDARVASIPAHLTEGGYGPSISPRAEIRAEMKPAQRSFMKNTTRSMAKSSRFLRAAGWTFTLSWLAEMASDALTPGISKVAAKRDQEMMFEQSLDSSAGATMRQRALQAIADSNLQVRQTLGNEATFLHQ